MKPQEQQQPQQQPQAQPSDQPAKLEPTPERAHEEKLRQEQNAQAEIARQNQQREQPQQ